jgi:chromosome segregation ATPase
MVEPHKNAPTEQINTAATDLDINARPTSKIQTVIANVREMEKAILDGINPSQVDAKQQRDAVDELLQHLQTAVEEENSGKAQEIKEINDSIATLEQELAKMLKSGKNQSRQAGVMVMIDDMRLDIQSLKAQIQANQGIYDDMAQEIRAKLEQRIKEVKEGARILVSADL